MAQPLIQRSFAGGELSPNIGVRADLARFAAGLRLCRNFVVQRHGGLVNRAGFRFIEACKTTSAVVQLLRYESEEPDESVLIEAGNGYMRFFQEGGAIVVTHAGTPAWSAVTNYVQGDVVVEGGVAYYAKQASLNQVPPNATYWYPMSAGAAGESVYEIPSPFTAGFNWVQSGQVITLTHKDVAPQELIFVSILRWIIQPVTTANTIGTPTISNVTGTAGAATVRYVVVAAAPGTYEQGQPSAVGSGVSLSPPSPTTPVTVDLAARIQVSGVNCPEYYVFRDDYNNGNFGYVGTIKDDGSGTVFFVDPGYEADFSITPTIARSLFASSNNYPHRAAYHQQRRVFAHTREDTDAIWASRTGFHSNHDISSPLQDDDAIEFKIAGNNHHAVRHLISLKSLVVLTAAGVWTVQGADGGPLTPSNLDAEQELYVGADDVCRPAVIGRTMAYVQARGRLVRAVRFDQEAQGLAGYDLTTYASHLFKRPNTIAGLEYQFDPDSILWAVRSDGTLLGLTYIPEEEVLAWHQHTTGAGGEIEHACVVPEDDEDALYVIVKRTIGGSTVRYIERLESREIDELEEDVFFVDSGLSYAGVPVSSVSGLDHLEGQVVAVVGDGRVIFDGDPQSPKAKDFIVTAGAITLGRSCSDVHVGLQIPDVEIETMEPDAAEARIRSRIKNIKSVTAIVESSSRSFLAGTDPLRMTRAKAEPYEAPESHEFSGQIAVTIAGSFSKSHRVRLRHTDPLPLSILGIITEVEVHGS